MITCSEPHPVSQESRDRQSFHSIKLIILIFTLALTLTLILILILILDTLHELDNRQQLTCIEFSVTHFLRLKALVLTVFSTIYYTELIDVNSIIADYFQLRIRNFT
jgi:uncharacterized BrkB/YihY/UPF0761 family membrane protein